MAADFTVAGFSCPISDDSLKNPFPSNYFITSSNPDSSSSSSVPDSDKKDDKVIRSNYSRKSSGLGGGAIAGFIISCVVFVAAVISLIVLGKSGASTKSSEVDASIDNTSFINKFNLDNKNPNMV